MRPRHVAALVLASFIASVAGPASAAPVDDKIELLRARPTGMDEQAWRIERRKVAAELGEMRSQKAADALIEVVSTERYDAVLTIAIQGLAKQGDARAIEPLQKIYRDRSLDTFVREEAAKAIEALGGTPEEDARLVGGSISPSGAGGAGLDGPQLGTMGAASVQADDELADLDGDEPLPENLRARDLEIALVLAELDLDVDTRVEQQPVLADGGLGAFARYLDERERWGWTAQAVLDTRIANGDITATPSMPGGDDGDVLFLRQGLEASGDAHVYFGKTDIHAFGGLGVSERLTHIDVEDLGGGNQDSLSGTRFALDVVPAAGLGWGRYLNAGSDLLVDAIVHALDSENILAKDLDAAARKRIRDALYRRSNAFSSYPRLAAVLAVLGEGGYLARQPSPRVVHRLRSIIEDPSYLERMQGSRVRAGFMYGVPIAQDDYFRRSGDHTGAPFLQFDGGYQLDRQRQILGQTRFFYDVIGDKNFTLDVGATYTRFLHTKFDDYAGHWFAGVRGGASQRAFSDLPEDQRGTVGYRAVGLAGYAYGFRRGAQLSVAANAGIDSGAFIVGAGLTLRIGIARGSVLHGSSATVGGRNESPTKAAASGDATRGQREAKPAPD